MYDFEWHCSRLKPMFTCYHSFGPAAAIALCIDQPVLCGEKEKEEVSVVGEYTYSTRTKICLIGSERLEPGSKSDKKDARRISDTRVLRKKKKEAFPGPCLELKLSRF